MTVEAQHKLTSNIDLFADAAAGWGPHSLVWQALGGARFVW